MNGGWCAPKRKTTTMPATPLKVPSVLQVANSKFGSKRGKGMGSNNNNKKYHLVQMDPKVQ